MPNEKSCSGEVFGGKSKRKIVRNVKITDSFLETLDKRRKWDIEHKWLNNENKMVKDLKYSFMLYTWTAKKTFDKLSGRQNHLPAAGKVIKRSWFYSADCGPYRGMVTCRSHWASSWGRWGARAS